ncbi:MAG: motility protein A [Candidatus Omnitrophota bacterium]|jgi:chemotaxis protein MotA|nr:MAG: motility protein A [Candidatus Omnitrophota bacterium]
MDLHSLFNSIVSFYLHDTTTAGLWIGLGTVCLGTGICLLFSVPLARLVELIWVPPQIFRKFSSLVESVAILVSFAERARREGILALETVLDEIENDFMRDGLRLAVDGVEPELIKDILQTELAFVEERHRQYQGILRLAGHLSLAMGAASAFLNFMLLFFHLDSVSLGTGIAVALFGPIFSIFISFAIFYAWAEKLRFISNEEVLRKEIMIEGVMSIQSGDNPRILEAKLLAFLPPYQRSPKE